jgi:hypothetical protein
MKLLLTTILLLSGLKSYSQAQVTLKFLLNSDALWVGIDNQFIISGDTANKIFILSSKNIDIRKDSIGYTVLATKANTTATLDLFEVVQGDTIKVLSKDYLVKRVPDPVFSIGGHVISGSISKSLLLKTKKIDVVFGDSALDRHKIFELTSFDMEIDGNTFHSNSNNLTTSMIFYLSRTKSNSIRIMNDKVHGFDRTLLLYKDKTFSLSE